MMGQYDILKLLESHKYQWLNSKQIAFLSGNISHGSILRGLRKLRQYDAIEFKPMHNDRCIPGYVYKHKQNMKFKKNRAFKDDERL